MSTQKLGGKRVAILVADGFEQVELTKPRAALLEAGFETELVSPVSGKVQGMHHDKPGDKLEVDVPLSKADPKRYDALLLPGGVANPDTLRIDEKAVKFIKAFVESGKPIAAICHGPWTLIEAGGVKGKTITSWPSLKTDLNNAGAHWVDQEVVVDGNLITSRKPDDIPAFNKKFLAALGA